MEEDLASEDSDSSKDAAQADALLVQGRRNYGVPIVLDTGFHTLKAGFAGECEPLVVIPTVVGRPRHQVCFPLGSRVFVNVLEYHQRRDFVMFNLHEI